MFRPVGKFPKKQLVSLRRPLGTSPPRTSLKSNWTFLRLELRVGQITEPSETPHKIAEGQPGFEMALGGGCLSWFLWSDYIFNGAALLVFRGELDEPPTFRRGGAWARPIHSSAQLANKYFDSSGRVRPVLPLRYMGLSILYRLGLAAPAVQLRFRAKSKTAARILNKLPFL